MTSPESPTYLEQKPLDGNDVLGLYTWVSDTVRPGYRMYQLHLIRNGFVGSREQFPTDYENYTAVQVKEMFDNIESVTDFRYVVREQNEFRRQRIK